MKKLVIVGLLLASALIAWGLGESRPAWGDSPVSPLLSPMCYVPMVARDWDGTKPTPEPPPPLPKHQGVGHDRKWEPGENEWLCQALELSEVSWYYDWSPYPIGCEGIESVATIFSPEFLSYTVSATSNWLQTFVECDFESQCGAAPSVTVPAYRQLEQMYPDMDFVGPAVWNLGYLEDFWDLYETTYGEPPKMDAVAIHLYPQLVSYYGSTTTLTNISETKLSQAITFTLEHNVPEVWVTEFTVQPHTIGITGTIQYMEAMVDIFESKPQVTRWAWFGLDLTNFWYWPANPELSALYDTSLYHNDDGELTVLGEEYRDAYPQ